MNCEKCKTSIMEEESVPYGGMVVCEDCAMDLMSPAKACDPWAVKMATGSFTTKGDAIATLQGLEKQLYELVEGEGKVASEEAAKRMAISPDQLRKVFTVLRHMELLRGDRRSDGGSDLVLFDT